MGNPHIIRVSFEIELGLLDFNSTYHFEMYHIILDLSLYLHSFYFIFATIYLYSLILPKLCSVMTLSTFFYE